ncbi:MAG: hypothetical protein RL341_693 [Pseudomonadota bacterium]|jgi:hypothetical protein
MGLLDDLRAEADAARGLHAVKAQTSAERTAATEEAAKKLVAYWANLHPDLNAISPKVSRRIELERDLILRDLQLTDFRVDHRQKIVGEQTLTDYALVIFEQTSTSAPNPMRVKRSSAEYETTRKRLFEVGIKAQEDIVRNEDQRMIRAEFEFEPVISAGVRFEFHHDAMQINVRIKNVEMAALLHADFEVAEVNQTFLDEMTKYLIDRPSSFPILRFKKAQLG